MVDGEFTFFACYGHYIDTTIIVTCFDTVCSIFVCYSLVYLLAPVCTGFCWSHIFRGINKFFFHDEETVT